MQKNYPSLPVIQLAIFSTVATPGKSIPIFQSWKLESEFANEEKFNLTVYLIKLIIKNVTNVKRSKKAPRKLSSSRKNSEIEHFKSD